MPDLFTEESDVSETTALATVPAEDSRSQVMSIIEHCATNPEFSVEKMRALLDMKRELDAQQAEQAYNVAMRRAQERMKPVVRDKLNKGNNSKYAPLETIHECCKLIWLEEGFSLSSHNAPSPKEGWYGVVTTCRHIGGHKTEHFLDGPPDDAGLRDGKNKTPIQGLGSTISYLRRYLALEIFDITLIGEDRDGQRGIERITEKQSLEIQDYINVNNLPAPGFLRAFGIESVDDLPAHEHAEAWRRLRAKKAELDKTRAQQ
jgi:hypothetical protein